MATKPNGFAGLNSVFTSSSCKEGFSTPGRTVVTFIRVLRMMVSLMTTLSSLVTNLLEPLATMKAGLLANEGVGVAPVRFWLPPCVTCVVGF